MGDDTGIFGKNLLKFGEASHSFSCIFTRDAWHIIVVLKMVFTNLTLAFLYQVFVMSGVSSVQQVAMVTTLGF